MQLTPYRYRHVTPAGAIPDAEPVLCGVCGARCQVSRNRLGPGSPQAVLCQFPRCDLWLCPRADQVWHVQAVRIAAEAEATASAKRKRRLLEEAVELIALNTKG